MNTVGPNVEKDGGASLFVIDSGGFDVASVVRSSPPPLLLVIDTTSPESVVEAR